MGAENARNQEYGLTRQRLQHRIGMRFAIFLAIKFFQVYYNITLSRRPQFWVGLVITPTFVIGSLIIIGECSENSSYFVNSAHTHRSVGDSIV